jgi:hypothetical protein
VGLEGGETWRIKAQGYTAIQLMAIQVRVFGSVVGFAVWLRVV